MWRCRWRDGGGSVRSHITPRRVLTWYLGVVLTLTALGGLLHWVAVRPTGLTRTFHADVGFAGDPLFQDRTAEVSLAFLEDDPALPRRFFSVEWRGYWFLPRAQTLDVYAGADDRVDVIVDGTLVLRRNFSVGSHTMSETVTLDAGAHEISIRYEQEGGGTSLNVQRAVNGEPPRAFVPTRLFPEQPDLGDFLFATGAYWLTRLVAVLWMAPIAGLLLVVAGRAGRRAWHGRRARGAPRTVGEFARRLSLVAFPTLLGPFVLLTVGPPYHLRHEPRRVQHRLRRHRLALAADGGRRRLGDSPEHRLHRLPAVGSPDASLRGADVRGRCAALGPGKLIGRGLWAALWRRPGLESSRRACAV